MSRFVFAEARRRILTSKRTRVAIGAAVGCSLVGLAMTTPAPPAIFVQSAAWFKRPTVVALNKDSVDSSTSAVQDTLDAALASEQQENQSQGRSGVDQSASGWQVYWEQMKEWAEDQWRSLVMSLQSRTPDGAAVVDAPALLPPKPGAPYGKAYTLVLSDKVLVRPAKGINGWGIKKRPGLDYFLATLGQHYELVIFSSALTSDVAHVLDRVDPSHFCQHRLFREQMVHENRRDIKPLDRLGRELNTLVVLEQDDQMDCIPDECRGNTVVMKQWSGAQHQEDLLDILPFLVALASKSRDPREVLASYNDSYVPSLYRERRRKRQALEERRIATLLSNQVQQPGSDSSESAPEAKRWTLF